MVYDLRKLSIDPSEVSVEELMLLVEMLMRDPTTWTHAAIAQWKHPISYDWAVLAATYDLHAQVHSGKRKPKPYPRPWKAADKVTKGTKRKDARDILRKAKDGDLEWQKRPDQV